MTIRFRRPDFQCCGRGRVEEVGAVEKGFGALDYQGAVLGMKGGRWGRGSVVRSLKWWDGELDFFGEVWRSFRLHGGVGW